MGVESPVSRLSRFQPGLESIHRVREQFARNLGIQSAPPDLSHTYIHPDTTRRISDAYDALPHRDPKALPHFEQMLHDTRQQYEQMVKPQSQGGLGMNVHVQEHDPYSGPEEMFDDVINRNQIKVMSSKTTSGHPIFGNEGNDMFRAVHDVFGHVGSGRGFDRHGEEAAYLSHAHMYSPRSRPALATETRGQNSWVIQHGGQFPDQKMATLPNVFQQPVALSAGNKIGRRRAAQQSTLFNNRQFTKLV